MPCAARLECDALLARACLAVSGCFGAGQPKWGLVMTNDLGAIESGNVTLPAELDIKAAAPLANGLIARRGNSIVIDGSQVERVGAQCLQVLLSAAATWRADGVELDLVEMSSPLSDALATAGLTKEDLTARVQ
jgi:chemotaxis protein CheX